ILGNDISNSLSFLTALTFLTRTFLFGLQNLVPYYNYYEHYGIESDKPLYHISKAIVQEWMTEQKIEGVIDQHRLYLFSLYLTETIFSSLPAIPIFIILNNQADVNLIKSIILRNFTDKVASVTGYNILISP
ncbi:transcriptional regulator, partial [Streptococcus pneumoniae]|nr:transcriptional regulator [Streptococcus pneumoniae]